ncbi:hypothetical protein VTN96DRAFT_625 [Rasamsonia emersonii]|uniref:DUF7514 domain-containing protein n=1 Tax=Rasamsonia emersonii (strain ATCC 16479 / CBS 393.64 / IMI 116815) TaxID=1408163 RepID=A0A0F4YWP2_RASE3|nr:hypothetical protein T310_3691 [Rasamsonia emersonii CBS 393.64]KKA22256.1 hypothetical protein T310_3691 [Rasamsonia emersonii CBS 393.64]
MESPHYQGGNYWGTLINPNKSAAPLLEQLCLGLAQVIATLEPSSGTTDLTPDKLAAFYREIGGNYDTLFLGTSGPALSFIYQALGCFHTLQPTTNPFEAPSIPALLPVGFVRWQTIQLLLCPDEHARYLQNAVSRWDVPNPNGGTFPKVIPREAFPAAPDEEMVKWHEKVSRRLEKDYQVWHNRHHSPRDFVRYYTAATDAQYMRSPEADYFFQDGLNHRYGLHPRSRAELHEDIRAYRRHRSAEGRAPWSSGFDAKFDNCAGGRRPGDSRASSPRRSPLFPPPPSRSKTMRMGSRERRAKSSSRHRPPRFSFGSSSPDSSDNEEEENPVLSRRRGSIDDRRHGRHRHLSPTRDPKPRRHSHDARSRHRSNSCRDRDLSNGTKREHDSPRPRRNTSSKNRSDDFFLPKSSSRHQGVEFEEYTFDDTGRSSRSHDHQYTSKSKSHAHRFHISSEESSPTDVRRGSYSWSSSPGYRSGSGSSSDRPRSSSNAGPGSPWSPGWDSPPRVSGKRVPLYD